MNQSQSKRAKSMQMRELTKNEKMLLGVLGILILGWLSYRFVITPQSEKIEAFSMQKIEYQDKINEINAILGQEDSVNQRLESLTEEKNALVAGFFPKLDQAQATYLLNDLLAVDEIEVIDINFERPYYEELGEIQVKNMNISIPYEGSYEGVIRMIRALQNSPRTIFIDRVSMDREDDGNLRGDIGLKIYGLDDLVELAKEDENIIMIPSEKRHLASTPFSAYSSYYEDQPQADKDDWWEAGDPWGPDPSNPPIDNNRPGGLEFPGDPPTEGLNPYSPGFSVDYKKENEISVIPNVKLK